MNWISFIAWLGALYALYYFSIIVLDPIRSGTPAHSDDLPVLTFSETNEPEKASMEDFTGRPVDSVPVPPSVGLGGISIKALFELARKDVIEYTRSVSF